MAENSFDQAKIFFTDVIDTFGQRYPRFFEENMTMFKVLHAFDDKLPMLEALQERNILAGVRFKKSSSEAQKDIAQEQAERLQDHGILIDVSQTTYASSVPILSELADGRPFIVGDHGAYYAHILPALSVTFGSQLVGVTEHTMNGQQRIVQGFAQSVAQLPYLSTAKLDLKDASDREIAHAIAQELVTTCDRLGKPLISKNEDLTVLMVGYGTMGSHAAQALQNMGCQAELLVTEISDKKLFFAHEDGCSISRDLEASIPKADVIVLATNVVVGKDPVLDAHLFSLIKEGGVITSMTSMDDEVRLDALRSKGTLKKIGEEGQDDVYKGPTGKSLFLMQGGKPANVGLSNGGAGNSIYLVEAAGIAGAFALAENSENYAHGTVQTLSDEDGELLAELWLDHFTPLAA